MEQALSTDIVTAAIGHRAQRMLGTSGRRPGSLFMRKSSSRCVCIGPIWARGPEVIGHGRECNRPRGEFPPVPITAARSRVFAGSGRGQCSPEATMGLSAIDP